eukprot:1303007-Amphidinium_carterae.1
MAQARWPEGILCIRPLRAAGIQAHSRATSTPMRSMKCPKRLPPSPKVRWWLWSLWRPLERCGRRVQ